MQGLDLWVCYLSPIQKHVVIYATKNVKCKLGSPFSEIRCQYFSNAILNSACRQSKVLNPGRDCVFIQSIKQKPLHPSGSPSLCILCL